MRYTYEYPRPAVTTDVVLLADEIPAKLLLIKRGNEPFKDTWALPGGFVDMDEDLPTAALRELKEETGISGISIKQFKTYGAVNRDPRHRTISVVYTSVVKNTLSACGMDDAAEAHWFEINELPPLAFDHQLIVDEALDLFRQDGSL
ncbi:NUDIX domain-containing protein [Carboxylicivirga marina]|uniref:NUDIX hydrolase n=1 Tax=Carboxylicivirga marina TaxID=2800988 RepID=A0ABS1HPK8_9BACT|nr:NUDIX hydrolase [Carboxylicivirga marina]MBK3519612.1 NUDIX hydrolase [Carboxylicivirga marina]